MANVTPPGAGVSGPAIYIGGTTVANGTNGYLLYNNNGVLGNIAASAVPVTLVVGSSAISGGTTGRVLYDNGGVLGETATTVTAAGSVVLPSAETLSWNSDTVLLRDGAANTLGQRNGTAAQVHRIYNTFTNASNYERAVFSWTASANVFSIFTEALGTGTGRDLLIGAGATNLQFGVSSGTATLARSSSSAGTLFQVTTTGGWTGSAILFARLTPIIQQGTTNSYTVLDINPTETSTGSGAKLLINGRIGAGASVFNVTNTGAVTGASIAVGGSAVTITAVNSVSPTSPNRTVTITYGGTTYYLAAKTTND